MEPPELLSDEEISRKVSNLQNWELMDSKHITAIFKFKDFKDALDFVICVGDIAESIQHHPEIKLSWGKVELIICTHDSGGLTDLDFKFAQEVQKLVK